MAETIVISEVVNFPQPVDGTLEAVVKLPVAEHISSSYRNGGSDKVAVH